MTSEGGQRDLDRHAAPAHLGEQAVHVTLEAHRGAVADAAGAGHLHRLADVEVEIGGGISLSHSSPACSATGTSLPARKPIHFMRMR